MCTSFGINLRSQNFQDNFFCFSDVLNMNSWKHLLATSRTKRLFIGRDHFQSDWFYRFACSSLGWDLFGPSLYVMCLALILTLLRKLLGTHFEAGDSVPPWRRG